MIGKNRSTSFMTLILSLVPLVEFGVFLVGMLAGSTCREEGFPRPVYPLKTSHSIKCRSLSDMLYTTCEIRRKMRGNSQVLPFEKGRFAHLKKLCSRTVFSLFREAAGQ